VIPHDALSLSTSAIRYWIAAAWSNISRVRNLSMAAAFLHGVFDLYHQYARRFLRPIQIPLDVEILFGKPIAMYLVCRAIDQFTPTHFVSTCWR
jgi:hypothetical protein